MKINTLLESQTVSSAISNTTTSAPVFGRDEDRLEETTTSGCMGSVANPVGKVRSRGSIFSGINTSEKFPNSNPVKEENLPVSDKKQKYIQAAKDVLKGADFDHVARVRNLDVEMLRKFVGFAHEKLSKGEYKLNRPNLEEYGDTKKGQKMLTKVQKRAVDRMIKADDKRDAKNAKKNQDTANRAWDRMDDKDLEEARANTAGARAGLSKRKETKPLSAEEQAAKDKAKSDKWLEKERAKMAAKKGVAEGDDPYKPEPYDEFMSDTYSDDEQGMAEAGEWTKLPNGNWRNMHTGAQQSTPPKTKKPRRTMGLHASLEQHADDKMKELGHKFKPVDEARVGNRMSDISIGSPKIVHYKGKAVGEVGIDHEASPGNGPYYMKHYLTGKDMVGYESKQQALADLKHLVMQYEGRELEEGPSEVIGLANFAMGGGIPGGQSPANVVDARGVIEGYEDEDCHVCGGTGEGRTEYDTCHHCKGSGLEPHGHDDDDFDMNDDDDFDPMDDESYYEKYVRTKRLEEKQRLDPKCWKGYKKQGTKMKGDTRVNNCVKVDEAEISEEMLAHELYKDLQIFKQGKDKTIGKKSKNKDISKKPQDRDIVVKEGTDMKASEILNEGKPGLWANIHAKRERIKSGSGERMRKPGSKGAPSAQDFKDAAKTEAANPAQQAAIAIAMKKKGQKPKSEGVDDREYNDEAGMFKNDLQTIQRVSNHLEKAIQENENLPEWCQAKIAQAKGMIVNVMDYMISQHENGIVDTLEEEFDLIESIVEGIAVRNNVNSEAIWEDLESLTDDELYVFAVTSEPINEDWQKANKKDKTDGMSPKAVKAYRRENPGSKLQTAVTTKPSKLKKGSKASKRRSSYCSRSRGQMKMHNISCSKTPDKAICKARRRWNC